MTSPGTRSGGFRAPVAALLFVLQAVGGGAVALAHASEPQTTPVSVETHHDASCVVIHDPIRCALCWYAGSVLTAPAAPAGPCAATVQQRVALPAVVVIGRPTFHEALPRAPPFTLS